MRFPTGPRIETFREIFDWITYDWDHYYKLNKESDGSAYYVNKLQITPKYLTYKTECYEIAPGLFEKVADLYEVIKED